MAVAVSVSAGLVSVSGAVAAAVAINTVGDSVTARVDDSTVSSTSAKVTATSTAEVDASATGVSVAIAAGVGAGAIALAGAATTNNVNMTVAATVLASSAPQGIVASSGDVEISADDVGFYNDADCGTWTRATGNIELRVQSAAEVERAWQLARTKRGLH